MELRIRGVSRTYPNGVWALKDVTLTVPAGMYGLLGPNGAGKSTLGAMEEMRGKIWRGVIEKAALAEVERAHPVISTKMLGGRTVVHVYGGAAPGPGFEPAEPDLEDVYFSTMAGHIGRRRGQAEPAGTP